MFALSLLLDTTISDSATMVGLSIGLHLPSPSEKRNPLASALFPAPSSATSPSPISPVDPNPQSPKQVSQFPDPPSFPTTKLPQLDLRHLIRSLSSLLPPWPSFLNAPPPRRPISRSRPLFRPYVAKVPWHCGVRAFLSQLFPRYGHYCGPNWSSGKDRGNLLWDKRPIDWLDFCCYCHDIGYDTHDQEKLLRADLAFLECLERPRISTNGDAPAANLYRSMCISGFRNILVPYRMQLVRLQGRWSFAELMGGLIGENSFLQSRVGRARNRR